MGFEKDSRIILMAGIVGARIGMPVRHGKGKAKGLTVVVKNRLAGCSCNMAEEVGKQHTAIIRDKGFMRAVDKVNGYGYAVSSYNKIG